MIEIREKSVLPIYGTAAVWLLYCLFFRLRTLSDFLILIGLGLASYVVLSLIFPGETKVVEAPQAPVDTGDERINAIINEGREATAEMKRIEAAIKEPSVKKKVERLIGVTVKIFDDLLVDPDDYNQVRRFSNYFLPATLKLLKSYETLSASEIQGENVTESLAKISSVLDSTIEAYEKQLDALFKNQALDIETDITVLESMLKSEGLSGKDF